MVRIGVGGGHVIAVSGRIGFGVLVSLYLVGIDLERGYQNWLVEVGGGLNLV